MGCCIPTACTDQRPFHRAAQIVCRVGDRLDPPGRCVVWQHHPGKIAVIGPRLQRCRTTRGNDKNRIAAKRQQIGQALRGQGFGCKYKNRSGAQKHYGNAHAQVRPCTCKLFGDVRTKCHGFEIFHIAVKEYLGQMCGN